MKGLPVAKEIHEPNVVIFKMQINVKIKINIEINGATIIGPNLFWPTRIQPKSWLNWLKWTD